MNEQTMLRDLADDVPLRSLDDLSAARTRLMAEITGPPAVRARWRPRLGSYLAGAAPRRRVLVGALAGAFAAVLVAVTVSVVVLAPGPGDSAAQAAAVRVLHQAAVATSAQPFKPPRPDQYLYVRIAAGDNTTTEKWLSIDGTHDSVLDPSRRVIPGCRDGQQVWPGGTVSCQPDPAYLPGLPTTGPAMTRYLESHVGAFVINAIEKWGAYILEDHYTSSASKAALFDAMANLPGLRVDEHATDVTGRPGIGVIWQDGNGDTEIVFDAKTYAYLGLTTTARVGGKTYVGGDALLASVLVDRVGQR